MPTKLPLSMSPLSCPISSQVVILVSIIIGFWFVFRHPGEVQPSCILGESEPWAVVVSTAWGACDSLSEHRQAVRVCVWLLLLAFPSPASCAFQLFWADVLVTGQEGCLVLWAWPEWLTFVWPSSLEPKSPVWAALRLVPSVGWFSGTAFLFHVI